MVKSSQIKKARDRLGESQAQFAKRFGVNQSTIQRWEKGRAPESGMAAALIQRVLSEIKEAMA